MKHETISVKYSLAKVKALEHYLEKEGKSIEGELLEHLDAMYDTQVPEAVREFVASQYPDENQQDEKNAASKQDKPARSVRRKQSQIESPTEEGPTLSM